MVRSSLLLIATLVQLVVVLVSSAEFEGSSYWPIYKFNNGVEESDKSCGAEEWTRLQTAMSTALEGNNHSSTTAAAAAQGSGRMLRQSTQRGHRRLDCSRCRGMKLCLSMTFFWRNGKLVGCATPYGHGRLLTEGHDPCSNDVLAVNAAFDQLSTDLSPSCQQLVNAPRHIECAKYTRDCDILGFTVWSHTNGAQNTKTLVTQLNATGSSFCKSAGYINIEARADFILGDVTLELSGAQARTQLETSPPYLAFGKLPLMNMGHNRLYARIGPYAKLYYVYGSTMAVGEYTIRAYSQGDPASGKTATFTVDNC